MKENEYQCEHCGGIFELEEDWTEEMKWEEYDRNFPGEPHETKAVVCDDCYKMMVATILPPGMDKKNLCRWKLLNFRHMKKLKAWLEECESELNKELEEMIVETLIKGTSRMEIANDKKTVGGDFELTIMDIMQMPIKDVMRLRKEKKLDHDTS